MIYDTQSAQISQRTLPVITTITLWQLMCTLAHDVHMTYINCTSCTQVHELPQSEK